MSLSAAIAAPAIYPEPSFPPSPSTFWQPLYRFGTVDLFGMEITLAITRPMVVLAGTMVVLAWVLIAVTNKLQVVPSRRQWVVEQGYTFIRNGVARDMIGSKHFLPYVPLLFSLFIVILFNNWAGIIPPIQLPTFGRIGMAAALVLIVYVVYHAVGIRKHGFLGYFKFMVPSGLPTMMIPAIFLLELMTFFITRPLTLALRLFGNMFAGHMLILVLTLGAWELVQAGGLLALVALPAWIMSLGVLVFEALIQAIQAYVFVLLAASYIGSAVAEEH